MVLEVQIFQGFPAWIAGSVILILEFGPPDYSDWYYVLQLLLKQETFIVKLDKFSN